MPQGTDANEVRGRAVTQGVIFTFSLEDLENLPEAKGGSTSHKWTGPEDEALLRFWPRKNKRAVAKILGVCETVARRRYHELTGEA
jgi:hypothetical protein